jgi:cytochrome c553
MFVDDGGAGGGVEGPIVETDLAVIGPDGAILSHQVVPQLVVPVDVALSPDGTEIAIVGAGDSFIPGLQNISVVSYGSNVSTPRPIPALPTAGPAIAVAFDAAGDLLVQFREPAVLYAVPPGDLSGGVPMPSLPLSGPVPGGDLGGDAAPEEASVEEASPGDASPAGDASVAEASAEASMAEASAPPPIVSISLSSLSRDDTGHDVFHAQASAMIACASCHPEGGDDGHVWNFNGQLRRTPSLRGTIAGTAPYHWEGEEKDFPALVNDVYTLRMDGDQLPPDQLDATQSWVSTIPAPPAPSWIDAASATRGEQIFKSGVAECSACHAGPKLTNNKTMDVGTWRFGGGSEFQVPPLVGVGWRTPLLHNGCAQTIADRFGSCATPEHGQTAELSSQDLSDLEMYLESL